MNGGKHAYVIVAIRVPGDIHAAIGDGFGADAHGIVDWLSATFDPANVTLLNTIPAPRDEDYA